MKSAPSVVLCALAMLGAACGPGVGPPGPLSGALRPLPDPARARPPYCDATRNCAVLPVEGQPRNLLPDEQGGLWYLGWRQPTNTVDLVHLDSTGRTAVLEPVGLTNGSLGLSALGAVGLGGDAAGPVTVAGQRDGVAAPFTSGWVGVRNADGTGWLRYFASITNNSTQLRSLSVGAVAWLPDGRLAVAGTCSGQWTTPLPLDCTGPEGDLVLLTFAADGSTVERRVLGAEAGARQLIAAPDGALYLQAFTSGSASSPKLGDRTLTAAAAQVARIDGSIRWVHEITGQGGPYVQPGGMTLARDGRLWSSITSASIGGGLNATLGVDGDPRQPVGSAGDGSLLITSADGTVALFRAAVTQGSSGLTGFAEVGGGEMVALWIVNGPALFRGGAWGPHPLSDNQLVEMLPTGQWRGLRKVGVSVAGTALVSDSAGRLFSLGVVLPEQPTAVLVRIDSPL